MILPSQKGTFLSLLATGSISLRNSWVHKPKTEKVVTGKPDAEKLACPVWEGAVGNVPQGNALATYFT
ncbi:hypothetical protein KSZ_51760 [Dictyobacter formicarum]|uniref:Uncharacterized protein n=1 Tax=Dictyobacter formicarum TaxID=2778368 RepID=A0ABQ3VLR8_9CHLR|nr:hypothetical protein KSZ_51760 [Dictyobacter formicarum]